MSLQFDADHPPFPLYEELEVSPRASDEVIRAAFGRLVRVHSNDRGRVARLNAAFDVLSNPTKRHEYDLMGIEGHAVAGASGGATRSSTQPRALILVLSLVAGALGGLELMRLFTTYARWPLG
jgi:curved DNA-binding protein CbpA